MGMGALLPAQASLPVRQADPVPALGRREPPSPPSFTPEPSTRGSATSVGAAMGTEKTKGVTGPRFVTAGTAEQLNQEPADQLFLQAVGKGSRRESQEAVSGSDLRRPPGAARETPHAREPPRPGREPGLRRGQSRQRRAWSSAYRPRHWAGHQEHRLETEPLLLSSSV